MGVDALDAEIKAEDDIYNLSGQRVAMPKKGFYIVRSNDARSQGKNDKKIIIR